jgi:hypothetical protein
VATAATLIHSAEVCEKAFVNNSERKKTLRMQGFGVQIRESGHSLRFGFGRSGRRGGLAFCPGPDLSPFEVGLAALAFLSFIVLLAHTFLYFLNPIRLFSAL